MSSVVNRKRKKVTGEGIGESGIEKQVPDWGWRRSEGSWF